MSRRILIAAAILLVLVVGLLVTSGPTPATPNPPGTFAFAALGDAPYYPWEEVKYRLVMQELEAHDLDLVLHVGDIFWHPCSDELYRKTLDRFNRLPHPVIYTPGDNEWTDCWEPGSGSFAPLERLKRIRTIFFADPTRSLGQTAVSLVSQARHQQFAEFVENVRWSHQGFLFATVHLVGSRNGMKPFPGRTAADDEEVKRRTTAAAAWVLESFEEARSSNAKGVILAFHGNPFVQPGSAGPQVFEPFTTALQTESDRFKGPVLAIHGDHHTYTVDHPFAGVNNFTRLEVPGSPEVGWIRVVVAPGASAPFTFEKHVVPRWKYW